MRASRTERRGEDSSRQGLSVLCDDETLNTERTEHLRDLSVEALEARRPQRASHWLQPLAALS